jgi:hypothetical protein
LIPRLRAFKTSLGTLGVLLALPISPPLKGSECAEGDFS